MSSAAAEEQCRRVAAAVRAPPPPSARRRQPVCCCSRLRRRRPPPQCPRARGQNQSYIMSRFCRAYKTSMTPLHDRPARSSRRSYAAGSNPGGRVLAERRGSRACAPATRRDEKRRSERRCFCCRGRAATSPLFWRRCSAVSRRARWRRRGVGAAINRAPAASGAERLPT